MSLARAPRSFDRRPQILDAAELCFARAGFHRTTMQDVAGEAGMVPGNLYRYFASKDALILALIERDRAEIAADFAALEGEADLMAAFRTVGHRHFSEKPREKAVLALEIWSEAARNPGIRTVINDLHAEVRRGIMSVCERAKRRGEIPDHIDLDAVARLILTLSDGLIRRRALDPDFESETEISTLLDLIGAMLCGDVALVPCPAAVKNS